MKASLYLGKIAGVKLFIHWTFLILLIWIFTSNYLRNQNLVQALIGCAFVIALFVCVILHEFGHAMAARIYKIPTRSITLLPIGGVAQIEKIPEKPGQEMVVAFAGPFVNLIIAAILFVSLYFSHHLPALKEIESLNIVNSGYDFLFQLLIVNISLLLFNLVPAFPMDGGRALRSFLLFWMDRSKATRAAAIVGKVFAVGFMIVGLFYNPILAFIGLFIFFEASIESGFETMRSIITGHTVREVVMSKFSTLSPDDHLSTAVDKLLDSREKAFVIMNNEEVVGILNYRDLIQGLYEKGKNTPVSHVMNTNVIVLKPDTLLEDLFTKKVGNGNSFFLVVEEGKLLGVIDNENITEFIEVNAVQSNLYPRRRFLKIAYG